MHAWALQVGVRMGGTDYTDDVEWVDRVLELPLTPDQKDLVIHLLTYAFDVNPDLLVSHDKEEAMANIKAFFARRRYSLKDNQDAVLGSCCAPCTRVR